MRISATEFRVCRELFLEILRRSLALTEKKLRNLAVDTHREKTSLHTNIVISSLRSGAGSLAIADLKQKSNLLGDVEAQVQVTRGDSSQSHK